MYMRRFDEHGLDIRLQVNDMLVSEYHTNNGFTKSTYKISEMMKSMIQNTSLIPERFKKQDMTWPVAVS